MSAGYSASSEADSGPRRPCQLTLSSAGRGDHAPLDQPPIGGGEECSSSLPLLVIDSPTNTTSANHSSTALLCTPCPSPSPRNKSPVTVQEWVDSLPLTPVEPTRPDDEHVEPANALPTNLNETDDILTLGAEAGLLCAGPASTAFPSVQVTTCREPSEAGSHCSSVESLLEARRPDPEEVLLGLGFGGPAYTADTGRIPARFLQPSKLKGVAIDDFLRHQQDLVHNFESGYWGYRGLTGPSHTIPSVIVAKIMEKLREHERENSVASPPPQPPHHYPHHHHRGTPPPSHQTNSDNNKFSRVAHNLLTKIRCGSVLTPDNRAWLDAQGGSKSPELARRRLILGQQSFTFSRDGHLIESLSPPSSLTDSDRWTSSTGTTGHNRPTTIEQPSKEVKVIFPSIEEDLIDRDDNQALPTMTSHFDDNNLTTPKCNNDVTSTLGDNGVTSLCDDNNVMSSPIGDNSVTSFIGDNSMTTPIGDNVTSLIVDEPKLSATSSFELSEDNDKQCLISIGDSGLPSSGRSSRGLEDLESPMGVQDDGGKENEWCTMNKIAEEDHRRQSGSLTHSEFCPVTKITEDHRRQSGTMARNECFHLTEGEGRPTLSTSHSDCCAANKINEDDRRPTLSTSHSDCCSTNIMNENDLRPQSVYASQSDWGSKVTERSEGRQSVSTSHSDCFLGNEDEKRATVSTSQRSSRSDVLEGLYTVPPEEMIQSLDKVIESLERIIEPLEAGSKLIVDETSLTRCKEQYNELKQLTEQMSASGLDVDCGSELQFLSLTANERCALQCRVVRCALNAYHEQLTSDDMHMQLKTCLGVEVQRLADLLDSTSDCDRLATIVKQMTSLLAHQTQLGAQLKGLVGVEGEGGEGEPQSCHELCEAVMRRVRSLELLVRRNAQELAEIRKRSSS